MWDPRWIRVGSAWGPVGSGGIRAEGLYKSMWGLCGIRWDLVGSVWDPRWIHVGSAWYPVGTGEVRIEGEQPSDAVCLFKVVAMNRAPSDPVAAPTAFATIPMQFAHFRCAANLEPS